MSRRVFLHVGLPKSGTSYLQSLLAANKDQLRERADLLFPGNRWHDQVLAVREVRDMRRRRRRAKGSWHRLRAEVEAWPGDAVISMEWLCAADEEHATRVVDELSPAAVEVMFTVRDLGRTLPAAWQEFIQNRREWSWEEFLEVVATEDPAAGSAGRTFWAQQDVPTLVTRWASVPGVRRTHVVTIPRPGSEPDVLWRRTAEVFGIDADGYRTEGLGANESLGLESAELVRRLNPLTREAGMRKTPYQKTFKQEVSKGILAQRRGEESVLVVPPDRHEWIRETAARHIEALKSANVHVVGNLSDLEPVIVDGGRQPRDVTDAALLDAAIDALVGLGLRHEDLSRDGSRLRKRLVRLQHRYARTRGSLKQSRGRTARLSSRLESIESDPVRFAVRATGARWRRRLRSRLPRRSA